jgi:hypothetical protein
MQALSALLEVLSCSPAAETETRYRREKFNPGDALAPTDCKFPSLDCSCTSYAALAEKVVFLPAGAWFPTSRALVAIGTLLSGEKPWLKSLARDMAMQQLQEVRSTESGKVAEVASDVLALM